MALASPSGASPSGKRYTRSAQLQSAHDAAIYAEAWVVGVQQHLNAALVSWSIRYWANWAAFCLRRLSPLIEMEQGIAEAQEREQAQAIADALGVSGMPPLDRPPLVERARDGQHLWQIIHGGPTGQGQGYDGGAWS